ncbi:hypothetical protein BDV40DRAFT_255226 [Aspergillus tamarii]|uniref:Uncharacterized protein n=1 Tax=Aspergillus tamarii TaxID=41984 RepID=A0A5N6V6M0_ASPTM|nr:hypothetical protein BDV40DRAFT_255226 [Aspergillus tamarii]
MIGLAMQYIKFGEWFFVFIFKAKVDTPYEVINMILLSIILCFSCPLAKKNETV